MCVLRGSRELNLRLQRERTECNGAAGFFYNLFYFILFFILGNNYYSYAMPTPLSASFVLCALPILHR